MYDIGQGRAKPRGIRGSLTIRNIGGIYRQADDLNLVAEPLSFETTQDGPRWDDGRQYPAVHTTVMFTPYGRGADSTG